MVEYLTMEDLLDIATGVVGPEVLARDYGLLEAAVVRPQASAFGQDAYPDLHVKAAALMHSLIRNHALVDGNKRLAWAACRVLLGLNDQWISGANEDERVDFVVSVASGQLDDLERIAERLRAWSDRADHPESLTP